MVEDMDEAAVYGSTMYHLLEEIFSVGRPANGEESELSDNGQEDEKPADDEAKAAAAQQQPTAAAEGTAGGGEADNSIIDPDRAWELFGRGEMDARRVLAVLTRIHGEATNAWWPFVRAALPPGEVSFSPIARVSTSVHEEAPSAQPTNGGTNSCKYCSIVETRASLCLRGAGAAFPVLLQILCIYRLF